MTQLDVIFGKQGEDNAIDPVCKMVVSKSNPNGGTAEHDGVTYYFCAPGCRGSAQTASLCISPARFAVSQRLFVSCSRWNI